MRKKMDTRDEFIPLAVVMGLCWRWFFEILGLFPTSSFSQKALHLEEYTVENSHKMGLLKVSRPSIWLTQCSQQSKDMPSSPSASVPQKRREADRSSACWQVHLGSWGSFQSPCYASVAGRERQISKEWDTGNPASWQEFSMERGCRNGWDLTCKRVRIQGKRILFLCKIKWRLFFPVELLVLIQLVPRYVRSRVQAFFITMSHLPPSNLHHWSKGSAVQWAPAGFFL